MNTQEVCEYLGIKRATFYRHVKPVFCAPVRVGKSARYRREDVEAWTDANVVTTDDELDDGGDE